MPVLKPQGQGLIKLSIKDNFSIFFLARTFILWTKRAPKVKFSDFWVFGWKFTKYLMLCLKLQVSFYLDFAWEISALNFFSWNYAWFGQKEPIKVQSFRLRTAHVKFHQIYSLIGLLLKVYKISAKKVHAHYENVWV